MFLTLLASCDRKVERDELKIENGLYYEIGSEVPFSGRVQYHFSGGGLSSECYLENGLVKKAIDYGYVGEVIYDLRYADKSDQFFSEHPYYFRSVLVDIQEGDYYSRRLDVIISDIENPKQNDIKELNILIRNNYRVTLKELNVKTIRYCVGELEDPIYTHEL
jgi:hypothetical protein